MTWDSVEEHDRYLAAFPFLAVNVVDSRGDPPEGIQPYVVEKLAGVEVGIIGVANPDTKNVTLPAATEGLTFLDSAASAAAVNDAAARLVAQGVETIVVVAHQGLETPTTGPLAGIVALLDGEVDATWVDRVSPDPEVQSVVERYQAEVDKALGAVVGQAASPIVRDRSNESEMGNFVTDAMRTYLDGVDVALTNAGGLRADIDAGPITLEEIYAVLPFNNTLVVMDLTGVQLLQVLEEGAASRYGTVQVSGLRWALDPDAPFGERVASVTVKGAPLDPSATYRVATNNFMAAGGDQFVTLTEGTNVVDTGVNLVDTVVRHLEGNSPVDPLVEGRLTFL